jgi:hypothetical protein
MYIQASGFRPEVGDEIVAVCKKHWPNWRENISWAGVAKEDTYLEANAQGNLVGDGSYDFATDIRDEIWRINGEYCLIQVVATDIDSAPFNSYYFDDYEYQTEGPGFEEEEDEEEASV